MVLLKGFDERGFVFYTNTESQKGECIAVHPEVALTFYWGDMQRQVRIEGRAAQVEDEVADAYFASRPWKSRIGALASAQSRPLESRSQLVNKVQQLEAQYARKPVPRPRYWTGYRVCPRRYEFWQLRLSRLHDRLVYERTDYGWRRYRLYP